MAELSAALNAIFPNLNKSAAAVTNKIREVKVIFTLYSDAKQRAMQSGFPADEVLVCVLLNIPLLLDVKTASSFRLSFVRKVMHMRRFVHDMMTENVMKLSSPQIPGNALVFYKEWTPLMEELKMHEQDDIVAPHTISMDNMVEGGAARLPQEVSVRSASSSVTPPLAPTACATKSSGSEISYGMRPHSFSSCNKPHTITPLEAVDDCPLLQNTKLVPAVEQSFIQKHQCPIPPAATAPPAEAALLLAASRSRGLVQPAFQDSLEAGTVPHQRFGDSGATALVSLNLCQWCVRLSSRPPHRRCRTAPSRTTFH